MNETQGNIHSQGAITVKNRKWTGIAALWLLALLIGAGSFTAFGQTQYHDIESASNSPFGFSFFGAVQTILTKPKNPSYAWLEDAILRESSDAMLPKTITPVTNYPYSRTLAEFQYEVREIVKTFGTTFETMAQDFLYIVSQARMLMVGMGVTESYEEQRAWLETEYQIVYPAKDDAYTEMYTTILYGTLCHGIADAMYESGLLYNKVEIPKGMTLEAAVILFVDASLESSVAGSAGTPGLGAATLTDYLYLMLQNTLIQGGYPVDGNTSSTEILRQAIIMGTRMAGIPIGSDPTNAELRASELAAAFWTYYRIRVNTADIAQALAIKEEAKCYEAMQRLVLETMIHEKSTNTATEGMSMAALFSKAQSLGYFALEPGFYSDIYSYRLQLDYKREYIWLMPVCYADLMSPAGKRNKVTIKINGRTVKDRVPAQIYLNTSQKETQLRVTVSYKDGNIDESKTYLFTVTQGTKKPPNNLVNDLITQLPNPLPTLPFGTRNNKVVTDAVGSTYYLGDALGDGLEYITDEHGEILGVTNNVPYYMLNGASGSGEEDGSDNDRTTQDARRSGSGALSQVKENWYYILGAIGVVGAGGSGYYSYAKKKGNGQGAGKKKSRKPAKDNRF